MTCKEIDIRRNDPGDGVNADGENNRRKDGTLRNTGRKITAIVKV